MSNIKSQVGYVVKACLYRFRDGKPSFSQQSNFPRCELFYQRQITLEKIEIQQLFEFNPGNLFKNQILYFSPIPLDAKEFQIDLRNPPISVLIVKDLDRGFDFDLQFFSQLSSQGIFMSFSVFDLSSWKFPFQRERSVGSSLAHQHASVFTEQTRYHFYALECDRLHVGDDRPFWLIDKHWRYY